MDNTIKIEDEKALLELQEDYKKWWISLGYPYSTTSMYLSPIRNYIKNGVRVNQKTIDEFRETHRSSVTDGALKSFLKFLVKKKGFDQTILDIRFERMKRLPKPQIKKALIESDVYKVINELPRRRLRALVFVLYELALRISEGLRLTWGCFNWSNWLQNQEEYGEVIISKSKGNKSRIIAVPPKVMTIIYEEAKVKNEIGIPSEGLIFDFGINEFTKDSAVLKDKSKEILFNYIRMASDHVRYELDIAGKKHGIKITPHMLRHSKATGLLNDSMSLHVLKDLLGHESLTTTEIYAKASTRSQVMERKKCDEERKENRRKEAEKSLQQSSVDQSG